MSSPSPDGPGEDPGTLPVEVVCALPERQWCISLTLPEGATVADALAASGLGEQAGLPDPERCAVGIWGRVVERTRRLRAGDRVEVYRPLVADPREARRRAAASGRTLGPARGEDGG